MPPRLAIVNPASGSGRTERRWTEIVDALRDRGVELEVELTSGPCDAMVNSTAASISTARMPRSLQREACSVSGW